MFNLGKNNPVAAIAIGILMLGVLGSFMVRLYSRISAPDPVDEVSERDFGRPFFREKQLEPFLLAKYQGVRPLSEMKDDLQVLVDELGQTNRDEMVEYLELQVPWKQVVAEPYRHVGLLLPMTPERVVLGRGPEIEKGVWLEVTESEGRVFDLLVHRVSLSRLDKSPFYLEAVYLGHVAGEKGERRELAVARELYEQPNQGIYPMMDTFQAAFFDILDDYKFPQEGREPAHSAFFHLLGMIQKGAADGLEVQKNVGYGELMELPHRYRATKIRFVGSLMYHMRRRISDASMPPGMEFYYEGLLLNSDRLEMAFRSLSLPPGVKNLDLIEMEGLFLQRYNFQNRMGRTTWLPLIIATKLAITEEKKMGLTTREKQVISTVVAAFMLLLLISIMRNYKRARLVNTQRRHPAKLKPGKLSLHVKKAPKKADVSPSETTPIEPKPEEKLG